MVADISLVADISVVAVSSIFDIVVADIISTEVTDI